MKFWPYIDTILQSIHTMSHHHQYKNINYLQKKEEMNTIYIFTYIILEIGEDGKMEPFKYEYSRLVLKNVRDMAIT